MGSMNSTHWRTELSGGVLSFKTWLRLTVWPDMVCSGDVPVYPRTCVLLLGVVLCVCVHHVSLACCVVQALGLIVCFLSDCTVTASYGWVVFRWVFCYILCIHSLTDGHLGCFCISGVVDIHAEIIGFWNTELVILFWPQHKEFFESVCVEAS